MNSSRAFCRNTGPCVAITMVLLLSSAHAHHSDAPHFHMDQNDRHEGVITEFKFVNPHGYIYFDETSADGSVESWRCELRPGDLVEH
ncbi:MAG: DUF6152 family protein [Gammaproteobacteria bacterium]